MARRPPSLSREYEYGRIVSVDVIPLGDNLAADASSGASSITVEDAADFDEDGGSLLLDGVVYAYSTWTEDDATGVGTITLSGTLSAAATEGTVVSVYDTLYLTAAADKVAQVELVGDDGNVDTLEASIALHLVDKLDEGVRGLKGEQVKLELEADEWVIVDIFGLGDPNASGTLFMQDSATVAATGNQAVYLTYEPITNSEHLYWNGLYQPGAEWTRDGQTVTVADPSTLIAIGDLLTVEYAYRGGAMPAVLEWESTGWRYLQITEADATDRSAPTFNDSSWSVARAPFGNVVATDGSPFSLAPAAWGAPRTIFTPPPNIGLWLRRSLPQIQAGATVTVEVRVDGDCTVYWNGNLVDTRSGDGTADVASMTVPTAYLGGQNVLAVKHIDDAADPASDFIYIDARVSW